MTCFGLEAVWTSLRPLILWSSLSPPCASGTSRVGCRNLVSSKGTLRTHPSRARARCFCNEARGVREEAGTQTMASDKKREEDFSSYVWGRSIPSARLPASRCSFHSEAATMIIVSSKKMVRRPVLCRGASRPRGSREDGCVGISSELQPLC